MLKSADRGRFQAERKGGCCCRGKVAKKLRELLARMLPAEIALLARMFPAEIARALRKKNSSVGCLLDDQANRILHCCWLRWAVRDAKKEGMPADNR